MAELAEMRKALEATGTSAESGDKRTTANSKPLSGNQINRIYYRQPNLSSGKKIINVW